MAACTPAMHTGKHYNNLEWKWNERYQCCINYLLIVICSMITVQIVYPLLLLG